MKNPKKLSLAGALKATAEPLVRIGDLIQVYFLPGDPEQRSGPFAPSMDLSVKLFQQPATEQHVRDLYRNGGWLESASEFKDEELSLYFDHGLGKGGDSKEFVNDFREVRALLPNEWLEGEQGRTIIEVIRRTLLHQHHKYKVLSNRGKSSRKGSSNGGANAGEKKKFEAGQRHNKWIEEAKKLKARGINDHDISGILGLKHSVSDKQMRTVLQVAGVLKKRK